MSLRILFVLNPVSGGKHKANLEQSIRDYFRDRPDQFECYNTTGKDDLESVRYWADSWKPDRVVAVGGDGTLKLVAEAMLYKNIPVGIIPAGSANGMARDLGIGSDFEPCMETVLFGQPKPVHVIRINEQHICLHLGDIGLNAQLVKYFEENDLRGKIGYARVIFRTLMRRKLMEVVLSDGEQRLSRAAFMVVFANARRYGTGARINPVGDLHDRLFEVILLRRLSLTELFKMLFLNRPFNPKKTELLQTNYLTVNVSKKAYFQVDGEYLGKTARVEARLAPDALILQFPKE